jgi:hypothetical protein
MGEEYVLEAKSVKPVTTTAMTVMYQWVCPLCSMAIVHASHKRTLSAAKLHLVRKHKLVVRVVEG